MNKISILAIALMLSSSAIAQKKPERQMDKSLIDSKIEQSFAKKNMTPMDLWNLSRVSAEGITNDGRTLVYGVSNYSLESNKSEKNLFTVNMQSGKTSQLTHDLGGESVVKIEAVGLNIKDRLVFCYALILTPKDVR